MLRNWGKRLHCYVTESMIVGDLQRFTNFSYRGNLYERENDTAMDSPISTIVANSYSYGILLMRSWPSSLHQQNLSYGCDMSMIHSAL